MSTLSACCSMSSSRDAGPINSRAGPRTRWRRLSAKRTRKSPASSSLAASSPESFAAEWTAISIPSCSWPCGKDPRRRYLSAQAFAKDIQRHLDGLPVLARSDTVYRLRKWVARRKTAAVAATAALVLAGLFGWQPNLIRAPGVRSAVRNKARPSVAVLGFKNLSGRPESSWISTALTEMLSTELAAGENLRAVPGERVAGVKMDLSLADADSYGRDTLTRL